MFLESLDNMKCVIFGSGGFIGSTIADHFLKGGHELRIFERPRVEPFRKFAESERVELIAGDFSSIHDVRGAISGVVVVLHLVSASLPKSSNYILVYFMRRNVVATLQMFIAMVVKMIPNDRLLIS
jgi:UDP-glucose 4-epimerase